MLTMHNDHGVILRLAPAMGYFGALWIAAAVLIWGALYLATSYGLDQGGGAVGLAVVGTVMRLASPLLALIFATLPALWLTLHRIRRELAPP